VRENGARASLDAGFARNDVSVLDDDDPRRREASLLLFGELRAKLGERSRDA
jgi:hypothetical protein